MKKLGMFTAICLIVVLAFSIIPTTDASPDFIYGDLSDGYITSPTGAYDDAEYMVVGDIGGTSQYRQGFVKFSLSGIISVDSATLYIYVYQSSLDGTSDYNSPLTNPGLGDCVVRHIADYGTLDGGDLDTPSIGNDPGVLIGATENPDIGYVSIDVTSAIQDDLANGRAFSTYMIRFTTSTDGDGGFDEYWFRSADQSGTNQDPYIEFTGMRAPPIIYVDAPSTVDVSTEFDIIISIHDIPDGWKMTFLDLIAEWDPNDLEFIECELLTSWQGECNIISSSLWWGSSSDPSGWTEDSAWFRIRFHCLRAGPTPIEVSTGVATIFLEPLAGGEQIDVYPETVTIIVNQVSTVGGISPPINKLAVLAPYLALSGLIAMVPVVYIIKRRKD